MAIFSVPTSFVYFIRCECAERFIKIGLANDPDWRLKEHSIGNPYPLTMLFYGPGDRSDEQMLHRRFKRYRFRGEWFYPSKPIMDLIDTWKRNPRATVQIIDKCGPNHILSEWDKSRYLVNGQVKLPGGAYQGIGQVFHQESIRYDGVRPVRDIYEAADDCRGLKASIESTWERDEYPADPK